MNADYVFTPKCRRPQLLYSKRHQLLDRNINTQRRGREGPDRGDGVKKAGREEKGYILSSLAVPLVRAHKRE